MTKNKLISALSEKTGEKKTSVAKIIDALGEVVAGGLAEIGDVTLPGVGKLKAVKKEARIGRNPRTGEDVEIAACTKIKLTVAASLKQALN